MSLSVVSPTTGVTVIEGRSQTTVIIVDDDGRIIIYSCILICYFNEWIARLYIL